MISTEYIIEIIREKRNLGKTIFVCGNGGSSANAEHFSNDLFSKGVKAVCLNSNTSIVTMIANDFGYEYIFSKQLEVYAEPGDLVIMLSCSGKSKNILKILDLGLENIEIFGGEGNYGEIEDIHLQIAHKICEVL